MFIKLFIKRGLYTVVENALICAVWQSMPGFTYFIEWKFDAKK